MVYAATFFARMSEDGLHLGLLGLRDGSSTSATCARSCSS